MLPITLNPQPAELFTLHLVEFLRIFPTQLPNESEVSVIIWTTTPWTLPANQAVCLNPDFDYAFVQVGRDVLVMAQKLVDAVAKDCAFSEYTILGAS